MAKPTSVKIVVKKPTLEIDTDITTGSIIINGKKFSLGDRFAVNRERRIVSRERMQDPSRMNSVKKSLLEDAEDFLYDKYGDKKTLKNVKNILVDIEAPKGFSETKEYYFVGLEMDNGKTIYSTEYQVLTKSDINAIKNSAFSNKEVRAYLANNNYSLEDYERAAHIKVTKRKQSENVADQAKKELEQTALSNERRYRKQEKIRIHKQEVLTIYKKKKKDVEVLVKAKKKALQQKISQKSRQYIRTVPGRPYKPNINMKTMLAQVKHIPKTVATPLSSMEVRRLQDIFSPDNLVGKKTVVKMKSADISKPASKMKIPGIKESKINSVLVKFGKGEQKFLFGLWYGCLVAATYFQILVSNTPVDEDYSYQTQVAKNKKVAIKDGNGEVLSDSNINKNVNKSIYVGMKTRYHKADRDSVRGDWVLTFRGKNFKAYETDPIDKSMHMPISYTFTEDFFVTKSDQSKIYQIADILFEQTIDSEDLSATFTKTNLNKRWQILEYGGYKNKSEAKVGAKYGFEHGVDSTHLTYQAPQGFISLTDALWNQLVSSGRWAGTVEGFLRSRKNKFDVSKMKNKFMQELLKDNPDVKKEEFEIAEAYLK